MHYSSHIQQYLDAIKGCDAFFVAEREHFKIINYISMGNDVFPNPASAPDAETAAHWHLRRQCRGLIFDHHGNVISLPIHKFFNAMERDETQIHCIDLNEPHVILDKCDGSMVRPIPIGDDYRLGTKMGMTEVAMQAEVWVAQRPNYDEFIRLHLERGQTPIFEWCSRKQRIVIDYPVDRLVLIAIRDLATGQYKSYQQMLTYGAAYDVEVVRAYDGTAENMRALVEETRVLQNQEGWIIRFDDGRMIKIKAEDYCIRHSAKDSIMMEKNTIGLMLTEKLDDIKPVLDNDTRSQLEKYETAFWKGISDSEKIWSTVNNSCRGIYGTDRKAFALSDMAKVMDGNLKSAIFRAWDVENFDWRQAVLDVVAKHIGSQNRVDAVRALWGGAHFSLNQPDE